jgi:16S rRNA (cytidine1402-2'-O)-methyltransferase
MTESTTLYIVATPIGNLEDISMRALRILGQVAYILCEDTRVTRKLLDHYGIKTPAISYHQHSTDKETARILGLLRSGKDLALVSDAGTPGISDPGGKLVAAVIAELDGSVRIESVPGPSAVTAALSISGIPTDKFVFLGFPPHKNGRRSFVEHIFHHVYPVVVYESKHRIIKFLSELKARNQAIVEENGRIDEWNAEASGRDKKERLRPVSSVVVCRELSKMHETVYRGDLDYIIEQITAHKDDQRGEFTVVIGK